MAGETQKWKDVATSIFDVFGDVVLSVTVRSKTGAKSYDSATGRTVATTTDYSTKLAWVQFGLTKFQEMFGPGGSFEKYRFAYVRHSTGMSPKVGDHVIVGGTQFFLIDKLRPDDAGTGAYYTAALIPVQNAS